MRRLAALLLVGFVLAFVVGLSPHLVHHLLEPDHHETAAADDCPFAALADRQPAAAPPAAPVVDAQPAAAPLPCAAVAVPAPAAALAHAPRAPPRA